MNDSPDVSAEAKSHYIQGLVLQEQDEVPEAIKRFNQAIAVDNEYYLAYYSLGLTLKERQQYSEAIVQFKKVTQLNDRFAKAVAIKDKLTQAYYLWGDTLMRQNKYPEAAEQYEWAVKTDEKSSRAYNGWALALKNLNQPDKAIEKLEKAIQANEKYALAYNTWGNILFERLDYEGAKKKYELATKFNPHLSSVYYNWGLVLTSEKRNQEAIEKFKTAANFDGNDADIHRVWGNSLLNLKRYPEAIEQFTLAIKLKEKNADAYNDWGNVLVAQKKYSEAIEQYKTALSFDESYFHAYRNWGLALAGLKQYEAAIEKYRQSIETIRKSGNESDKIWLTYAQNNIAEVIWRQGKYKESRREWEKTRNAYEQASNAAKVAKDADYFLNWGNMLQSALLDLDGAEAAYQIGLELDPASPGILSNLVSLYLEKKDAHVDQSPALLTKFLQGDAATTDSAGTAYYWKARQCFLRAREILKARIETAEYDDVYLRLGQLALALGPNLTAEQYEEAEQDLLTALAKDTNQQSGEIRANLGVLYARMENYSKAVLYLGDAMKLDFDDLTIRSSLAEAYLKDGSTEKAETEFKKILSITPNHVESHIGLAEVYKTMGDADDDPDMYYRAIREFNEGMRIAKSDAGSKKLTGKSLGAAYYSRGYARVKLYESSRLARDERLLNKARSDFYRSKSSDPENFKAARALEKMGNRFGFRASQRAIEKVGPWLLFLLSLGVFTLAQFSILSHKPIANLAVGYYVLMTFGSLIWMVASIYLPQLLKLKVAGIELEKSAVEQITTPTSLEISS